MTCFLYFSYGTHITLIFANLEKLHKYGQKILSFADKSAQYFLSTLHLQRLWKTCLDCALIQKLDLNVNGFRLKESMTPTSATDFWSNTQNSRFQKRIATTVKKYCFHCYTRCRLPLPFPRIRTHTQLQECFLFPWYSGYIEKYGIFWRPPTFLGIEGSWLSAHHLTQVKRSESEKCFINIFTR